MYEWYMFISMWQVMSVSFHKEARRRHWVSFWFIFHFTFLRQGVSLDPKFLVGWPASSYDLPVYLPNTGTVGTHLAMHLLFYRCAEDLSSVSFAFIARHFTESSTKAFKLFLRVLFVFLVVYYSSVSKCRGSLLSSGSIGHFIPKGMCLNNESITTKKAFWSVWKSHSIGLSFLENMYFNFYVTSKNGHGPTC